MMTVSAVDELRGTSERGAGGDGGQRAGQHREGCRRQHRRLMLECGGVLLQRSLVEKLRWLLEVHMSRGVNLRVERGGASTEIVPCTLQSKEKRRACLARK